MKEPIPYVEGGERLACDGCGQHVGPKDANSPTGTEVVTTIQLGPRTADGVNTLGDWHQTCILDALKGGWAASFHEKLMEAGEREAVELGMPSMEAMAKEGLERHRPSNVPSKALKSVDDILKELEPLEHFHRTVAVAAIKTTLEYVPDWGPLLLFAVSVRDMGPLQKFGEESPENWTAWGIKLQQEAGELLSKMGIYPPSKGES